jgi:hypothetical protein
VPLDFMDDGDVNGDGKVDIAIADGRDRDVAVLLGNGDGSFGEPTYYYTPFSPVWWRSMNLKRRRHRRPRGGVLGGNSVSVWLGHGDGVLALTGAFGTGSYTGAVAIGDMNGDGLLDVATANTYANTVSVLLNQSAGSTTPTLLSMFDGSWVTEGIELRWQFGEPASFRGAELERSSDARVGRGTSYGAIATLSRDGIPARPQRGVRPRVLLPPHCHTTGRPRDDLRGRSR